MKFGAKENTVLVVATVFVLALLILTFSPTALQGVQKMVAGIVKMWNSFISKDIVGIV